MASYDAQGARVGIRRPTESDCDAFLAMAQASAAVHHPWVDPPKAADAFAAYLQSRRGGNDDGFVICEIASDAIAGVVNLNCIVRRHFQSAYLGYYIAAGFHRRGFMTEGLNLAIDYAFAEMGLHRLEANVQPGNVASIALVKKCGFRKEGFSPGYLEVLGKWRDHERWALLADER